jgi:hypothetical protein
MIHSCTTNGWDKYTVLEVLPFLSFKQTKSEVEGKNDINETLIIIIIIIIIIIKILNTKK